MRCIACGSRVTQLIESLAAMAEPGAVLMLRTEAEVGACPALGWDEPQSHRYGSMVLHLYLRSEV